jgi:hypothetical protein
VLSKDCFNDIVKMADIKSVRRQENLFRALTCSGRAMMELSNELKIGDLPEISCLHNALIALESRLASLTPRQTHSQPSLNDSRPRNRKRASREETIGETTAFEGLVHIERMLSTGRRTTTSGPVSPDLAHRMVSEFDCDVLLEENRGDRFSIGGNGAGAGIEIKLPPRVRCMLVLAMANVGQEIRHDMFDTIPDLNGISLESRAKRIHQYRMRLNSVLGKELSNRIFADSQKYAYQVRPCGWSFCWVRFSESPDLRKFLI